jgi:hypothetical protein
MHQKQSKTVAIGFPEKGRFVWVSVLIWEALSSLAATPFIGNARTLSRFFPHSALLKSFIPA